MTTAPRNTILVGDALEQLRRLASSSLDCCVTSPPYYQLRDYGVHGQLGLEPSVDQWVAALQIVCSEIARVLKPTGSLWLNLGDSFSRHRRYGLPPKSLLLGPERLLLALAADGWLVRNKIVWTKPNAMPASVTDRLNLTYEAIYFLVRSPRYYFDLDAIREPHRSAGSKQARAALGKRPNWAGPLAGSQDGLRRARAAGMPGHPLGKNPGDVWSVATRGYRGAHFATFPEDLVRRPILATCPERVCTACGQPWTTTPHRVTNALRRTLPSCDCAARSTSGMVLDPFLGTGTVGVVARDLGRDWLGIELNPDYAKLARQRLDVLPKPDAHQPAGLAA